MPFKYRIHLEAIVQLIMEKSNVLSKTEDFLLLQPLKETPKQDMFVFKHLKLLYPTMVWNFVM